MATRSRTSAPAPAPEPETPAVEETTAAAPSKPTGFNLPRVVAKAPKPVEPPAEKVVYAASPAVSLSGVARGEAAPAEKKSVTVRSLRDIGR